VDQVIYVRLNNDDAPVRPARPAQATTVAARTSNSVPSIVARTRRTGARTPTSFSPPAMHTVTHVPRPATRTLSQPSKDYRISSNGFRPATIMARLRRAYSTPWAIFAAAMVLWSSMVIVIGPTPPGTGVIRLAFSLTPL
jgi:hypothetical protein